MADTTSGTGTGTETTSEARTEPETRTKSDWVGDLLAAQEGPLLRYAARILGDVERARDVVQDTFLRLCGKEPHELEGHAVEWLFTVCRNRALDVKRKESRMKTIGDSSRADARESREPGPLDVLERGETAGQILAIFGTLPDNQQEVIRLKFQGGLSYKEISGVTDLTVSNVGFLLHTALKTIRTRLKADSGLASKA